MHAREEIAGNTSLPTPIVPFKNFETVEWIREPLKHSTSLWIHLQ